MAEILDMNVSAISHQLKRLNLIKLVSSEKRGRTIFYSMRKNKFNTFIKNLFSIIDRVYTENPLSDPPKESLGPSGQVISQYSQQNRKILNEKIFTHFV